MMSACVESNGKVVEVFKEEIIDGDHLWPHLCFMKMIYIHH
jgi:hypothetical protein